MKSETTAGFCLEIGGKLIAHTFASSVDKVWDTQYRNGHIDNKALRHGVRIVPVSATIVTLPED